MSLKNKKILVTCGATWVAVDPVRVISNCSSGELGKQIAGALKKSGAKVTLLEGPGSYPLDDKSIRVRKFRYFSELAALFNSEIKRGYACVVHAAAVSDYQLRHPAKTKCRSGKKELVLRLSPTPKLINRVKKISPRTFLVGFKLESSTARVKESAQNLFKAAGCDLVIANSLRNGYRGLILDKTLQTINKAASRTDMADKLIQILKERL